MSPSTGQAWTRRIRTGYYDDIRVSDAERSEVAELLGRHYSDGRLDKEEFDDRVSRAMAAKTRADLNGLFDDLPSLDDQAGGPGTGPGTGPGGIGGPGGVFGPGGGLAGPARGYGVARRPHRHPILGVIVALVIVSLLWHGAHVFFFPWLPILIVAAVVFAVTRATRHRHEHHHQHQGR